MNPLAILRGFGRLFGPDLEDLFDGRQSLGVAQGWRGLVAVLFGVGLAAYSIILARHAWGSAVFLGVAGALMVLTAFALQRAASSLFGGEAPAVSGVATGRRKKELEREKALLLKAIKELEFDHEMNKVSDEDFAEIGGVYRARAIRVIRQLDETKVDYAALIEEELTKKRGAPRTSKPGSASTSTSASKPESATTSAGASKPESATTSTSTCKPESTTTSTSATNLDAESEKVAAQDCPQCATTNDADAVFCKKCARRLRVSDA